LIPTSGFDRNRFFPPVAAQFIRKLKMSPNRLMTVVAVNNIIEAFRKLD
jgi:hypothetical protein